MPIANQLSATQSVLTDLMGELYSKGSCERFGITAQSFAVILSDIAHKYCASGTSESELRSFFLSLRVEELVLARACAEGDNSAWEIFLTRYREKLYLAALRIAREGSAARELADNLYADLYGTATRDGQRASKLATYTGRGSLEGWLRTVLAQEYVNRYRKTKRLVSLEEESEEGAQFSAPEPEPVHSADPRLEAATDEALASLSAEERTILAAYFLDGRTLAEIAGMLGVHESTISRKVDKLTKGIRKQVMNGLVRKGLSRRQAEEALDVDVRDLQLDIRRKLAQESPPAPFSSKKAPEAKTREGPRLESSP